MEYEKDRKKKQYLANLSVAKLVEESLGIEMILSGGSLLGAYRDKDVIKGDEDDIDFAVPNSVAQHRFKEVLEIFFEYNFRLKRLRDTVVSFERGGCHIDFIFFKDYKGVKAKEDKYYYETLYHKKEAHALLVPKKYWDSLGTIEFLGITFQCPRDIEGFLEYRYGDWKTPVERKNFGFQNFIDKGIMLPL